MSGIRHLWILQWALLFTAEVEAQTPDEAMQHAQPGNRSLVAVDPRAWYSLGRSQLYRRQFEQARKSAERAVELDPQSVDNFLLLGEANRELNDHNGAYQAWLKANKLNPNDARVTYYLGRLFYEVNVFTEAAAWFRETLRADPKHFAAMTYLGLSAEGLGMSETAEQLYRRAIEESKRQGKPFSWAFLNFAKLLRQRGDEAKSFALLEEGEKSCPEPHLLTALGQALAAANRQLRAEAVLRRAIQMDSSISAAHYALSLSLRAQGKLDEAKAEMEKFREAKRKEPQDRGVIAIRND